MRNPKAPEALQNADTLQLFHLSMVLERPLSDPKRALAEKRHLPHGQTVPFVDVKAPGVELRMRTGMVVRVDTKTISIDCDDGTNWRVAFSLVRPMIVI